MIGGPDSRPTWALGDALSKSGALDKAIAVYGRVIEHDPGNTRAAAALARLGIERSRLSHAHRHRLPRGQADKRRRLRRASAAQVQRRRRPSYSASGRRPVAALRCRPGPPPAADAPPLRHLRLPAHARR